MMWIWTHDKFAPPYSDKYIKRTSVLCLNEIIKKCEVGSIGSKIVPVEKLYPPMRRADFTNTGQLYSSDTSIMTWGKYNNKEII